MPNAHPRAMGAAGTGGEGGHGAAAVGSHAMVSLSRGVPHGGVRTVGSTPWGPHRGVPHAARTRSAPGRSRCGAGAVSPPPQSVRLRCRLSAFLAAAPGLFSLPVAEFLGQVLGELLASGCVPGTEHGTGN